MKQYSNITFFYYEDFEAAVDFYENIFKLEVVQDQGHCKLYRQGKCYFGIVDSAYGTNVYIDDRTVDSHIKRLRKKFKDVDKDFSCIETLYGVGYRYREG